MKKRFVSMITATMMIFSSLSALPVFADEVEAQPLLIAQTQYGTVQGVAASDEVSIFKGIPYAAPPVGDLRWAAPVDPEPWDDVLVCDEYAPMTMQILSTTDWYGPEFYYDYFDTYPNMSEDCLYLNVVTPATSTDEKLPVIVWYHGGANMHGYSYEPEFDSEELAKKGVIVVTVGFRLGVFGWMATPELSEDAEYGSSGNYGLLDAIKALEWVNDNIEAFGGDPDRITIAGQSAGAGFVTNLMISPMTEGLYQNAFMSSRTFNTFGTLGSLEKQYESCQAYLDEKGYGDMTLEELRALPTSAFMNETTEKTEVYNKGFSPCLDGYSLTVEPVDVFTQEGGLRGVNIMLGDNSGDYNDTFSLITKDEFYEANRKTYGDLYDEYDFESLYVPSDDIGATFVNLDIKSEQMTTKYVIFGEYLSELNPDSNIYIFRFSHFTPGRESELRKAWHSADLWYWFDSMRDIPQQRDWTTLDYQIGDLCSQYWVNFASTGSPNGGTVPYWPTTTIENPIFMSLDDEFELLTGFYLDTYREGRDELMRAKVFDQFPDLNEVLP